MPFWRRLPRNPMRILIAGAPRSGTSMLANLMTSPSETLILYEPNLGRPVPSRLVQSQLRELGLPVPGTTRALLGWLDREVARWGAKEVTAEWIDWTYDRFKPETVLLVVRDVRHAAISMYDRASEVPPGMELSFRESWLIQAAQAVVELYHRCGAARCVVVRYESFVADPGVRRDLEARLGWQLQGRLGVGFESQHRSNELHRHAGQISQASLELRRAESDPGKLEFAEEIARSCAEYQRLFGYPDPSQKWR
jgi:hypothetical protein